MGGAGPGGVYGQVTTLTWHTHIPTYTHPLAHIPTHPHPPHPPTHTPTSTDLLTYHFIYRLTNLLTHPLSHSLTHPLTNPLTHPLTHLDPRQSTSSHPVPTAATTTVAIHFPVKIQSSWTVHTCNLCPVCRVEISGMTCRTFRGVWTCKYQGDMFLCRMVILWVVDKWWWVLRRIILGPILLWRWIACIRWPHKRRMVCNRYHHYHLHHNHHYHLNNNCNNNNNPPRCLDNPRSIICNNNNSMQEQIRIKQSIQRPTITTTTTPTIPITTPHHNTP